MPRSFHVPSLQWSATIGETDRSRPVEVLAPLAFSKDRLAEEMGDLNYFGLARLNRGCRSAATADLTLSNIPSAKIYRRTKSLRSR